MTQTGWKSYSNYVPSTDGTYYIFGTANPITINKSQLIATDALVPAFQIAYTATRVHTQA